MEINSMRSGVPFYTWRFSFGHWPLTMEYAQPALEGAPDLVSRRAGLLKLSAFDQQRISIGADGWANLLILVARLR